MLKGLAYEEVDGLDFIEPSLQILEDFYDYLINNNYKTITADIFTVKGNKKGNLAILFYDCSKYYHYALSVYGDKKYSLLFRFEDNVYRLYKMDEEKEFNNLQEMIEYFNSVSSIPV